MADAGVYIIRNTATGCVYVGSTYSIEKRWLAHQSLLGHGQHHNKRLQADWLRYGPLAFDCTLVAPTHAAPKALEAAEQHWPDHYRAVGLVYNQDGEVWRVDARPQSSWQQRREARRCRQDEVLRLINTLCAAYGLTYEDRRVVYARAQINMAVYPRLCADFSDLDVTRFAAEIKAALTRRRQSHRPRAVASAQLTLDVSA